MHGDLCRWPEYAMLLPMTFPLPSASSRGRVWSLPPNLGDLALSGGFGHPELMFSQIYSRENEENEFSHRGQYSHVQF